MRCLTNESFAPWFGVFSTQCRRAGLPVVEARNDVAPGLQAVSRAIAAGLLVDPRCSGLLGEIGNYVWATERGGGRREVPRKVDDACGALCRRGARTRRLEPMGCVGRAGGQRGRLSPRTMRASWRMACRQPWPHGRVGIVSSVTSPGL
jgi:hypothetical protein